MEALTKIVVTLSLAVAAFGQPPAVPGWKLSIGELRKQYNHYGVGRRLKPVVWPNNSRVAVALSFDSENATAALAKGEFGSSAMSRGMYGSIDGLPRILNMLDRRNVPASFFIPAVCALLNPEMIPLILSKKRHEIGVHGWIHENPATLNDAAEESRLLKQAIEVLTKAMGKRPAGYRAPSWAMSPYTMGLVREAGFLYDSSLMASDGAYEVTIDGRPSGVIELPIEESSMTIPTSARPTDRSPRPSWWTGSTAMNLTWPIRKAACSYSLCIRTSRGIDRASCGLRD